MNFTSLDWIGLAAGTLTTLSFIPQVVRIVRTRSADDISWGMFAVFASGTTLWIRLGHDAARRAGDCRERRHARADGRHPRVEVAVRREVRPATAARTPRAATDAFHYRFVESGLILNLSKEVLT